VDPSDFLLDPDIVFLNHGSFGACPRQVFEQYQEWQRELERRPVEFLGRRIDVLLAAARAALGAYVSADPDDLVFVQNATTGVNLAAWALDLQPGDEVLTTSLEYGALDLAWEHICAHAPARYVRMPVTVPLDDPVEQIWSGVTDRTRVLFLSHITSETAVLLPVEELSRRARERGIRTVVDGAHVPGHIPLDLRALDVDYYAGNCHKWLCAPKGAGFLYVRRELQETIAPLVIGWGYEGEATFLARHEKQGTRDPSAFLTVPAAIEWQREHEWDAVRARCRDLAARTPARLALDPIGVHVEEFPAAA
jgi:isopenicillin-N epimerase